MKTRAFLIAITCILSSAMLTACGDSSEESLNSSVPKSEAKKSFTDDENSYGAADIAEGADDSADYAADSADMDYYDGEEAAFEAAEEAEAFEMDDAAFDMFKDAEFDSDYSALDVMDDYADNIDEELIEVEPIDVSSAFILTAGEWNDNNNWGFFTNLINNELISFPSFGLDPTHRIAVTVENNGEPVKNKKVELIAADDSVVWSAVTDKEGTAYLFFDNNPNPEFNIRVEGVEELTAVNVNVSESGEQGGNTVTGTGVKIETGEASTTYTKTEVMFILDTTGSMGDEIMYLQKDFSSIAEEVYRDGMTFSVNFYRDKGDDYVTKCNPFTDDTKEVQKLLNSESADGGGDFPEAIADILEETITNGNWGSDTNKVAFLIFDAPPHSEKEVQIQTAIESASEKGIHIIPVVASNADRETELFGRAVSIMTNSNYVFLTDDSGVGGSHLEPIIGDYDVELLHDIIVRNINEIAE